MSAQNNSKKNLFKSKISGDSRANLMALKHLANIKIFLSFPSSNETKSILMLSILTLSTKIILITYLETRRPTNQMTMSH